MHTYICKQKKLQKSEYKSTYEVWSQKNFQLYKVAIDNRQKIFPAFDISQFPNFLTVSMCSLKEKSKLSLK